MVDIAEFYFDTDFAEYDTSAHNELDLAFLEAIDKSESMFSIDETFFDSLSSMSAQPAFVPSLHTSVFEEPVQHAVWTSAWPETKRHFPV